MLPRHYPDRIHIVFDDHRLVANAGLILPSTLALRLGLPQLVDRRLDLGHATGRANTGDKMMTLVASALAGGDCINDADALRAGGTARVLGFTAKAPSTLGTFLRSFRWGHVRQLDRVSREMLARAWAAGEAPRRLPRREHPGHPVPLLPAQHLPQLAHRVGGDDPSRHRDARAHDQAHLLRRNPEAVPGPVQQDSRLRALQRRVRHHARRADGQAPDLPDRRRPVPLQPGRQPGPGPGLSSQLHPTSHPCRTGKPLCATEKDILRHPYSETPGPSLPLGPGGRPNRRSRRRSDYADKRRQRAPAPGI